MRKIKNPKVGEYVLITKYSDKDIYDPWALGFFSHKIYFAERKQTSYFVRYSDGKFSQDYRLKNCFRLTKEEGERWFAEAKRIKEKLDT